MVLLGECFRSPVTDLSSWDTEIELFHFTSVVIRAYGFFVSIEPISFNVVVLLRVMLLA